MAGITPLDLYHSNYFGSDDDTDALFTEWCRRNGISRSTLNSPLYDADDETRNGDEPDGIMEALVAELDDALPGKPAWASADPIYQ